MASLVASVLRRTRRQLPGGIAAGLSATPRVRVSLLVGAVAAAVALEVAVPTATDDVPMAKAETVGMSYHASPASTTTSRAHGPRRDRRRRHPGRAQRQGRPLRGQGCRTRKTARMQKDTIFSLMSMTKPIVSTALMMLWEDGRFLLDDPISKWLPSYANKQVMENGKLVGQAGHHPPRPHAHLGPHAHRAPVSQREPHGHPGQRDAAAERQRAAAGAGPRRRRRSPRRSSAPRRCRWTSSRARGGNTDRRRTTSPSSSRRWPG